MVETWPIVVSALSTLDTRLETLLERSSEIALPEAEPAVEWVVTVAGDAPFVPRDLVERLHAGRQDSAAVFACAASRERTHPVIALWPVSLRHDLRRAVAEHGMRKVDRFTQRYSCATVDWPVATVDPFFNVNTPEDWRAARCFLSVQ